MSALDKDFISLQRHRNSPALNENNISIAMLLRITKSALGSTKLSIEKMQYNVEELVNEYKWFNCKWYKKCCRRTSKQKRAKKRRPQGERYQLINEEILKVISSLLEKPRLLKKYNSVRGFVEDKLPIKSQPNKPTKTCDVAEQSKVAGALIEPVYRDGQTVASYVADIENYFKQKYPNYTDCEFNQTIIPIYTYVFFNGLKEQLPSGKCVKGVEPLNKEIHKANTTNRLNAMIYKHLGPMTVFNDNDKSLREA